MQWLRHTRFDPPTLAEQQSDVVRQKQIKMLAAQADERWASKPSVLDTPDKQQPVQMLASRDSRLGVGQVNLDQQVTDERENQWILGEQSKLSPEALKSEGKLPPANQRRPRESKENPWKQSARVNPGEDWQPESWTPVPARRRG